MKIEINFLIALYIDKIHLNGIKDLHIALRFFFSHQDLETHKPRAFAATYCTLRRLSFNSATFCPLPIALHQPLYFSWMKFRRKIWLSARNEIGF